MGLNFRTRSISFRQDLSGMWGACCNILGCTDTTAALCNDTIKGTNDGRFYHHLTCNDVNCNYGVCCIDGHCTETTVVGCYARGGVWIGQDYDCDSYDCSAWSMSELNQACCFGADHASDDPANAGYCEDLKPSVCLSKGGTPRGPASTCSIITAAGGCSVTGATAYGKCCADGQCKGADETKGSLQQHGYTPGDCSAIGGVWGGSGSTCGIDKDQVGGNTFDRSWPCSYPTGACCFGVNPFAGIIYCGSSGHTYGSCLNPPSEGGSGGSAWQIGVTCGFLNDIPLQEINPSPTPIESGPSVGCLIPGTLSGSCCVSTTETCWLDGPYENQALITEWDCYETNYAQCNSIGGEFDAGEEGCDGVECGVDSSGIIGCCGMIWQDIDHKIHTGPCVEGVDILSCQQQAEEWLETNIQGEDYNWAYHGFGDECYEILSGNCDNNQHAPRNVACCSFYLDEQTGEMVHFDCKNSDVVTEDWEVEQYSTYCDDTYRDDYPAGIAWYFSEPIINFHDYHEDFCSIVDCSATLRGACCLNGECFNSIKGICETMGGISYPNLYCGPDCGYLPCCSGGKNDVNVCINESLSGMNQNEIDSVSHCVDKFDFSSSEFNYQTALEFILEPAGPVHNIESLTLHESSDLNCEDCNFSCTRNRGICCWGGKPIYNTTKEECNVFGGNFAECTGLPFNFMNSYYVPPDFDCSQLVDDTSNRPTNPRSTAIPNYTMERMRRGPFGKESPHNNLCAAGKEDWEDTDWINTDTNGIAFNHKFDNNPTFAGVHLFWNAPTDKGYKSSGRENGYLKGLDHADMCKGTNLENCHYDLNRKGSCCVKQNIHNESRLKPLKRDGSYTVTKCVENKTQCECAVLNRVFDCSQISDLWIPNTKENSDCSSCPCYDIDNDRYQINSNCFTSTTKIKDLLTESEISYLD